MRLVSHKGAEPYEAYGIPRLAAPTLILMTLIQPLENFPFGSKTIMLSFWNFDILYSFYSELWSIVCESIKSIWYYYSMWRVIRSECKSGPTYIGKSACAPVNFEKNYTHTHNNSKYIKECTLRTHLVGDIRLNNP